MCIFGYYEITKSYSYNTETSAVMSGFTYGNPALPSGYRVIVCKTLCLSKELPRSLMSQPFGFYPYFVI